MKPKLIWIRIAQWAVVALCAITLKQYYSVAGANELRWILAPTTLLVEIISGISFTFESYAGYLSSDRSFLIAPSCAGVNFLITAFLMLTARKLLRDKSEVIGWRFIPAAALVAYLVTLIANTVRIAIALRLGSLSRSSGVDSSQLHRVEGIFVYSCFLLLLFVVSEKICRENSSNLLRHSYFPILVYYVVAIGVPLANGGYRQGFAFWQHSAVVLMIPLLLITSVAGFVWLWRRVDAGSESDARA